VLYVEGFEPVFVEPCEKFPNGSIVEARGRLILAAPHSETRERQLQEVLEIMREATVSPRLKLQNTKDGESLIFAQAPGSPQGKAGSTEVVYQAHQAHTPLGQLIVKAGEAANAAFESGSSIADNLGSKLLKGSQVSQLNGFTVHAGDVIFAQLSRSREVGNEVSLLSLEEFQKALAAGLEAERLGRIMNVRLRSVETKAARIAAIQAEVSRLSNALKETHLSLVEEYDQLEKYACEQEQLPAGSISMPPLAQILKDAGASQLERQKESSEMPEPQVGESIEELLGEGGIDDLIGNI